mmetsp:Transcript_18161/g.35675  ORF Transcript_18161/g.35675 Transcript_18161/m.35675 type:complete len:290 (-) Transcript_18161:193-1062(-)|eukprot:CAMPEP_0171487870 /NCGR_PEP_ID=MMETSP0958-20121227/1891_1 /TAXON_ID=87120 /ORGANISM="Aurantiochytrium limacinum, Strain ATCCMYA-1381" /LENGTH=289 /DNA_ID=CAMNT_0012020919 /DNA_START=22 /DNA_END=891 /DNA_ORIENTATION=-
MVDGKMAQRVLKIVRLGPRDKVDIWRQLQLEEGLHRSKSSIEDAGVPGSGTGWVVLNHPQSFQEASIVLGFSGKIPKLVNEPERKRQNVPMIRRYTGGGTVIVDENTVFISMLLGKDLVPNVDPFPRPIMSWSGEFYSRVLNDRLGVKGFSLRADDYVVDNVKIAGNAQAISGKRWVHHTSFLWDYSSERMKVLSLPEKQPEYRANRDHDSFLRRMKEIFPPSFPPGQDPVLGPATFLDAVESELTEYFTKQGVHVEQGTVAQLERILEANPERRQVTRFEEPVDASSA